MPGTNVSNAGCTERRRRQQRRADLLAGWSRTVHRAGHGDRGHGLRDATGGAVLLQETPVPRGRWIRNGETVAGGLQTTDGREIINTECPNLFRQFLIQNVNSLLSKDFDWCFVEISEGYANGFPYCPQVNCRPTKYCVMYRILIK